MEHVEVLRRMRSELPLATDEGPALDAAIAALSAQQPASVDEAKPEWCQTCGIGLPTEADWEKGVWDEA